MGVCHSAVQAGHSAAPCSCLAERAGNHCCRATYDHRAAFCTGYRGDFRNGHEKCYACEARQAETADAERTTDISHWHCRSAPLSPADQKAEPSKFEAEYFLRRTELSAIADALGGIF